MADERRCTVKIHDRIVEATFELWGTSVAYDNGNNPFPVTVAIVQYDDGQIAEVEPTSIRFAK